MTRLAIQHQAVNLSQGFTDEAPAYDMVWGGIAAILGGTSEYTEGLENITLRQILERQNDSLDDFLDLGLKDILARLQNPRDQFNQYSFPFGIPELRQTIADYTVRFYHFYPEPETQITVVLGATEGLASVLRAICEPGDGIIIFQPFHEMYPSQAQIFGLRPEYVTLKENITAGKWELDREELESVAQRDVKAIIVNTPHNPTGKVFTEDELNFIAHLAKKNDLLVVTDEIYEHILYGNCKHCCLAAFDGMQDRTFVVNSISKTGNATGWRIGWVISPVDYTTRIRSIHDTLVIQAPTPLQKGASRLLGLGDEFFKKLRDAYKTKCEILMGGLESVGFQVTPPDGSYYLFANYRSIPALKDLPPMDAAMFLIEKIGVASVPGDNFYRSGTDGDQYLRFAFCRGLDTLHEAARRFLKLIS